MKFEEAFDQVWSSMSDVSRPKGDNNYPKIITFAWNMVALALAGKKGLDDICYIDENQNLVSIPIEQLTQVATEETKPKKGRKKKDTEPEVTEEDELESTKKEDIVDGDNEPDETD